MAIPARYVDGNLIFTLDGRTWALFEVLAPTYGRMPLEEKMAWHTRVSAALMSLPGESRIFGVTQPIEPGEIVASMVAGVDLAAHPMWAEIARGTLDSLAAAKINRRATYLAVCLPALKGLKNVSATLGAATAGFTRAFSIPALPVSSAVVRAARAVADDLTKPLASILGETRLVEAKESDVEWLYARAALRGLDTPSLSEFRTQRPTPLSTARLAALGEPVLFEGGQEEDPGRVSPRYVRVDSARGTSYQVFGVLSHMPGEFVYPTGQAELLARLDDAEYPVDWCVCIVPTANAEARMAITSEIRKMALQADEYRGDRAGAPDTLPQSLDEMRVEMAHLNESPSTPECRVTFVIGFGAATLGLLGEQVGRLNALLEANEFKMPLPFGEQAALWEAMLPGSPMTAVLSDYGQFMLPGDIAGCAPFIGSALGDPTGPLFGLNHDAGGLPVQLWVGSGPSMPAPRGPKSGSVGIFGRLGRGKSFAVKRIFCDTLAMGGRGVTTDRTRMGEYVRIARALEARGYSTEVIPIGEESDICLDPLLVFEGDEAIRIGTGFLTLLTGVDPTDAEGSVLDAAVRRVVERGGRLREVPDELLAGHETNSAFIRAAENVSLKVQVHARGGLARIVFGDGRPVQLDADFIVFHAPDLQLPSAEALHAVKRNLLAEQVFASALLYLITAVASKVAFAERDRLAVVAQDEGYVLTDSVQGTDLLFRILRDGRKAAAVLVFASHHPDDLPERLRELLGTRMLFGMDRAAAPAGLRFMGMEVTDRNLYDIDETNLPTGRCFMRDMEGRLGLVQVLEPRTAELKAAFDTGLSRAHHERTTSTRRRRPLVGQDA